MNAQERLEEDIDYLTALERADVFKQIGDVVPHTHSDNVRSALAELSAIKQRGEALKADSFTRIRDIELIDYILKGETK